MASDSIMHYEPIEADYNDYQDGSSFKEVVAIKRKYYTSNSPDSFIKNAITGVPYPYKVGAKESRRLFKLVDTTGIYDNTGVKIKKPKFRGIEYCINLNPNHLYYDTPEECMRHMRITFQPAFIEQWNKTRSELFSHTI
jgi:hypothetical protein